MRGLAGLLMVCAFPAAGATSVVRCGGLLDVRAGKMVRGAAVVVEGDRIARVQLDGAIPRGATEIDWSGFTCLPGLIDVHVHMTANARLHGYQTLGVSLPRRTVTGVSNAGVTLRAGFTTVRNLGSEGFADVALRDGADAGEIEGPRMLVSGPALGITGGHCDSNLLAPEFRYSSPGVADGPWAARARVRENIKYGADVIKICASGGVMSKGDQPGTPQYTLEEMRAIVEEAHKLGRKVAAHAHGAQSIREAIEAGADSVEHCSFIDDEGIRLAKTRGTFLVFDIYNDDFILAEGAKTGLLAENIEKERQVGQLQRENFQRAHRAGVRMAFGTDAGVYPHGDNARQFAYMVRFGMTPIEAIRTATTGAAELLGWADRVGGLEPGLYADIIAVEGNPAEQIAVLEKVRFVMKGGKVVRPQ
jgi:imidazolonepropionase-like amidohydrolase